MIKRIFNYAIKKSRAFLFKLKINSSIITTGRRISFSVNLYLGANSNLVMGNRSSLRQNINIIVDNAELILGKDVSIDRGGEINSVNGAKIVIGDNTWIGGYCNIRCDESITIGTDCYFAQFVSIVDGGYEIKNKAVPIGRDKYNTKKVIIGNNVWIGTGVIILPGVVIGDGSVIGAGAVVTSDIPAYAIAVGMPAKVMGFRE